MHKWPRVIVPMLVLSKKASLNFQCQHACTVKLPVADGTYMNKNHRIGTT